MAATQLDKATAICERIAAGIRPQLDANAPGWEPRWLLMTPANANLAYIAIDGGFGPHPSP